METAEETPATDPMKFTRERLSEIGEVWVEYAKSRTDFYKGKLPDPIKQLLKAKEVSPPAGPSKPTPVEPTSV